MIIERIKLNLNALFSFAKVDEVAVSTAGSLGDEKNILYEEANSTGEILQRQYCYVFNKPNAAYLALNNHVNSQKTVSDIGFLLLVS